MKPDFSNFTPHPKPTKGEKKKQKPIRVKSRKMNPEELKHMIKVKLLGCIVKNKASQAGDSCYGGIEYHHITDCGRRVKNEQGSAHFSGIPLCTGHHRTGKISIQKNKKKFFQDYGTEKELLEQTKQMVQIKNPQILL